jgi:very-short-patch-repair endonuclease
MKRRFEQRAEGQLIYSAIDRKLVLARKMRRSPTACEHLLWFYVRNRQLGWRFRRQAIVGGYILDFFCSELSLGIEIDGSVHDKLQEQDELRTLELSRVGVMIHRITNDELLGYLSRVLTTLKQKCIARAEALDKTKLPLSPAAGERGPGR